MEKKSFKTNNKNINFSTQFCRGWAQLLSQEMTQFSKEASQTIEKHDSAATIFS